MSWRWSAALLAMFLAWPSARCTPSTFTLQGANVRVVYPVEYRNISIAMALADFGRPSYGATIRGKLVYPSEDPIYYTDGKARRCAGVACQYACGMLNTSVPPFQFTKSPGELLIMLLDRGPRDYDQPCYFITKVYNAQLAGADAVLVADDIGGEDLTTPVVPEEEAAAHLLDSLTISAALIRKEDGDTLKSLLQSQRPVTVALNWSDMEPRKQQVSWEYWTTTSDQCGTLCAEQTAFLRAMKPVAVALDQQNRTAFSPHFMIWSCPPIYSDSIECQSECILDGQYCAPDPDGQYLAGYSGKDVLAMNVRSLCFARLARQAGLPWLWWDYADRFAANCTSATNSYNATCAQQVFTDVTGPLLLNNNGTAVWEECVATGSPPTQAGVNTTGLKLPLLEEELNAQQGDSVVAAVSILPTVRVNGLQYRGTLDKKGVLRAICSAFPKNQEPTVCNEKWVSDDECEVGSVGYINCRVGDPLAGGNTRCINTFSSYECDCGQGWVAGQKDTGEQVCNDVNECLATNVRLTDPKCSCERCACINTPGSYKCTGELPQSCSPQYNFGGCWSANVDGALHHACVDTIWDYKRKALNGTLDQSLDKWYRCQCPGCFSTAGGNDGNPQCSKMCDMSQCVNELCVAPGTPGTASGGPVPAPSGGGGGRGGGGGSGGMSAWGVLLVVLVSVGVTMGGLYAVYHYVLRQRMEGEIRDIMSQYMPLGDSNLRRGGGGGGSGRARNGATSLSPVEEEGDAYEDAPLMGISSSQSSGGTARPPVHTGGSMQLQTVSSGASLGALPSQRSAFGSLMSPPAHHAPPSLPSPSGYQPPLPLPDDDEDSSGLAGDRPAATALVSRESGGGGKGQAGGAQAKPAAPVGEAPLLGEGPL